MTDLTADESRLVTQLLYMTGREERLTRDPPVDKEQRAAVSAIWPHLKNASARGVDSLGRCDLLNRLLLALAINPVSEAWFEVVFTGLDFSDLNELENRVKKFRTLCMLEFGNFRFGYKQLRKGNQVPGKNRSFKDMWAWHFPTPDEVSARANTYRTRPEPAGLIPIDASQLFSLGYLASEYAPLINEARKQLLEVIDRARTAGITDFPGLRRIAEEAKVDNLTNLLAKAGIPGTEDLIYGDLPFFAKTKTSTYSDRLMSVRERSLTVDENAIRSAQEAGIQNARTYMAMHDLDVYVATSMRDPLHFTTNWALIQRLFHQGELEEWHLHYFDPTQAFLEDRVQKGLLECLMIKRAKLSVYNAQEADTFGKDAEAGVTLAQGKPVIVYVARFGEYFPELQPLYDAIDQAPRLERDALVDLFANKGLVAAQEKAVLLGPEKTKADAVSAVIASFAPQALAKVGEGHLPAELLRLGYDPTGAGAGTEPVKEFGTRGGPSLLSIGPRLGRGAWGD